MRDESLIVGPLSRFGCIYEAPVTSAEWSMIKRPRRVIRKGIQDWRMGRRPDNPHSTSPAQTVNMSPVPDDFEYAQAMLALDRNIMQ